MKWLAGECYVRFNVVVHVGWKGNHDAISAFTAFAISLLNSNVVPSCSLPKMFERSSRAMRLLYEWPIITNFTFTSCSAAASTISITIRCFLFLQPYLRQSINAEPINSAINTSNPTMIICMRPYSIHKKWLQRGNAKAISK